VSLLRVDRLEPLLDAEQVLLRDEVRLVEQDPVRKGDLREGRCVSSEA